MSVMTDDGFVKIWGGSGPTKQGVFVRWTFALREDGSVLAMVAVRLSDRHEWHEIARRAFPLQVQGDARDWVRGVIAPYNVPLYGPSEEGEALPEED